MSASGSKSSAATKRPAPRGARFWLAHLPSVLFLIAFALFYASYTPYRVVGENLLPAGDFEVDPTTPDSPWKERHGEKTRWEPGAGREGSGAIRLEERLGWLQFIVENPRDYEAFVVDGHMKADSIVLGERHWRVARILLFFSQADGRARWDWPSEVCRFEGSVDWTHCRTGFTVPDFATKAHLLLQNSAAEGVAWADDVKLYPAELKGSRYVAWTVLAFGWLALFVQTFVSIRLWRRRYGVFVIVFAVAIVVGVAAPANSFHAALDVPLEAYETVKNAALASEEPEPPRKAPQAAPMPATEAPAADTPPPPPLTEEEKAAREAERIRREEEAAKRKAEEEKRQRDEERKRAIEREALMHRVQKTGHMVLFALLAVFCFASARRAWISRRWALLGTLPALMLFAAATELLQLLIEQRTPRVGDWVLDVLGALAGLVLAAGFHRLLRRSTPEASAAE